MEPHSLANFRLPTYDWFVNVQSHTCCEPKSQVPLTLQHSDTLPPASNMTNSHQVFGGMQLGIDTLSR